MSGSTLVHTLQCWREARSALDHAIQNYLDKTIALQSDLQTHRLSGDLASVQNALPKTWADDIKVPANYAKLAQTQTHLNQIRNSCLPINTLPLEILSRVFRLSAFHSSHAHYNTSTPNPYDQDDRKDLLVLTHICTHWREILLSTQTFWSRFEINTKEDPELAGQRARAYLDRASDAPLSFYLDEHPEHELDSVVDYPALKHFGAQFDRLARLALMGHRRPRIAEEIMMLWMKNGKPGTLHTLMIRMDTEYWFERVINLGDFSLTSEQIESFLGPIRVLYLNGLRFHWDSSVYRNLVVLRMGSFREEYFPQIDQLLAILSACPQLHTLQLFKMNILPSDLVGYEPVHLVELEYLSLTHLAPESYSLLLPSIFSGSKDLTFRVSSLQMDEVLVHDSIRSFLTRTNVTRVHIQQCINDYSYDISVYLSSLPHLQILVLDFCTFSGERCLAGLTRFDESKGAHIPLCPHLHTVYLLDGSFSTGVIQQVVESHHIRKLRFLECKIDPSEHELRCWLQLRVEDVRFYEEIPGGEIFDWYHL
ncbi:putative isoamyl alcohol oxidase, partial [Rhizoctonia solani 123E]